MHIGRIDQLFEYRSTLVNGVYCAYVLCVTYMKLDMWQVQMTPAMRRCIWSVELRDPIEHAVPATHKRQRGH